MALHQTEDGSVVSDNGKVLFFSIERFIRDICEGDCCFICGVNPSAAVFNDEHVIPDWILRQFNLHSMEITLPNRAGLTYSGYKVPCCEKCNLLMSDVFESPISKMVRQGYRAVADHLGQEGPWLFFKWLALIYLKTHLKDRNLRLRLDLREGDEKISDFYTWEELHHIHCIARSFYTGAHLDHTVLGSLVVLPAKIETVFGNFDYRDMYAGRTMLLRLGEVGIVSVLNDSCAALNILKGLLGKITGPLSSAQLKELMARMALINLRLKERPVPASWLPDEDHYVITAQVPAKIVLDDADPNLFGKVLHWCCEDVIAALPPEERERVSSHIEKGTLSFLWDRDGKFINSTL